MKPPYYSPSFNSYEALPMIGFEDIDNIHSATNSSQRSHHHRRHSVDDHHHDENNNNNSSSSSNGNGGDQIESNIQIGANSQINGIGANSNNLTAVVGDDFNNSMQNSAYMNESSSIILPNNMINDTDNIKKNNYDMINNINNSNKNNYDMNNGTTILPRVPLDMYQENRRIDDSQSMGQATSRYNYLLYKHFEALNEIDQLKKRVLELVSDDDNEYDDGYDDDDDDVKDDDDHHYIASHRVLIHILITTQSTALEVHKHNNISSNTFGTITYPTPSISANTSNNINDITHGNVNTTTASIGDAMKGAVVDGDDAVVDAIDNHGDDSTSDNKAEYFECVDDEIYLTAIDGNDYDDAIEDDRNIDSCINHGLDVDHDDHAVVFSASNIKVVLNGLINLRETIVEFITTNKTLNNDEDVQRIITTMKHDGSKRKCRRMKMIITHDDGSSNSSNNNNNTNNNNIDGIDINRVDDDDDAYGDAYDDDDGYDSYDDNDKNNTPHVAATKDNQQQQLSDQQLSGFFLHLQTTVEDVTILMNKVILCYHNETMYPKINFMEFRAGDIALFMPAGIMPHLSIISII